MYLTIDKLMLLLEQAKESGIDGDTNIVFCRVGGYLSKTSNVRMSNISKTDSNTGFKNCQKVANRGVKVLEIW